MQFTQEETKPGREGTKIKNSNQSQGVNPGFALTYMTHSVELSMLA